MRRVSSCLIAAACFMTGLGLVYSQPASSAGRGVASGHGAGRAGFGVRGSAATLPTGAGFIPVGSAGGTLAFGRYGSDFTAGRFGGGRASAASHGSNGSAYGYGRGGFGYYGGGYSGLAFLDGCLGCVGQGAQQTLVSGVPGLPAAAGIREAPVSPPAIYVIGGRTRPGRQTTIRQGGSKMGASGRAVGDRPDLAASPSTAPKIIRLDERS